MGTIGEDRFESRDSGGQGDTARAEVDIIGEEEGDFEVYDK